MWLGFDPAYVLPEDYHYGLMYPQDVVDVPGMAREDGMARVVEVVSTDGEASKGALKHP